MDVECCVVYDLIGCENVTRIIDDMRKLWFFSFSFEKSIWELIDFHPKILNVHCVCVCVCAAEHKWAGRLMFDIVSCLTYQKYI